MGLRRRGDHLAGKTRVRISFRYNTFNKQHDYKIQEYLHQVSEQPTRHQITIISPTSLIAIDIIFTLKKIWKQSSAVSSSKIEGKSKTQSWVVACELCSVTFCGSQTYIRQNWWREWVEKCWLNFLSSKACFKKFKKTIFDTWGSL